MISNFRFDADSIPLNLMYPLYVGAPTWGTPYVGSTPLYGVVYSCNHPTDVFAPPLMPIYSRQCSYSVGDTWHLETASNQTKMARAACETTFIAYSDHKNQSRFDDTTV